MHQCSVLTEEAGSLHGQGLDDCPAVPLPAFFRMQQCSVFTSTWTRKLGYSVEKVWPTVLLCPAFVAQTVPVLYLDLELLLSVAT